MFFSNYKIACNSDIISDKIFNTNLSALRLETGSGDKITRRKLKIIRTPDVLAMNTIISPFDKFA